MSSADQGLFLAPPPRQLSADLEYNLRHASNPMLRIMSGALLMFGLFYLPVFFAMQAPWQVFLIFGAFPACGIVLRIAATLRFRRLRAILRTGTMVEGELVEMTKASENPDVAARTSIEMAYAFDDATGTRHEGLCGIPWREAYRDMEPGDTLSVCYDPARPDASVPLLILE